MIDPELHDPAFWVGLTLVLYVVYRLVRDHDDNWRGLF